MVEFCEEFSIYKCRYLLSASLFVKTKNKVVEIRSSIANYHVLIIGVLRGFFGVVQVLVYRKTNKHHRRHHQCRGLCC